MINRAQCPVIYAGQGVLSAGASDILMQVATKANIPVTTTLMGLGGFDEFSPLSLHMLGMHGSAYANYAMQAADLVISIGARFDDRVTGRIKDFLPEARRAEREDRGGVIHFDIAPENIGKSVPVTLGVEGDARKNLEALLPMLEHRDRTTWFSLINKWKATHPFSYKPDDRPGHMKPQYVIEELCKQTNGEAIITTGVGQHQMWAAQFYKFRHPRQWVTSGGLGTMGFGLPSAIGAKLARPDKIVVDIDGDGSFCMTGMELCTAAQYGIGMKALILNNDFQGMVKQWQDLFYQERYSHTEMHNPDFVKMAEAMNCRGLRCEKAADLPKVMAEFLACDEPVVLEALVEKHEHVYPMVPVNAALHEMKFGDTLPEDRNDPK
jgi:acetolactate synthase-1/2/3 large subunit